MFLLLSIVSAITSEDALRLWLERFMTSLSRNVTDVSPSLVATLLSNAECVLAYQGALSARYGKAELIDRSKLCNGQTESSIVQDLGTRCTAAMFATYAACLNDYHTFLAITYYKYKRALCPYASGLARVQYNNVIVWLVLFFSM